MTHLLNLNAISPQNQNEGGYRLEISKKNFPLLNGVSFYKLGQKKILTGYQDRLSPAG